MLKSFFTTKFECFGLAVDAPDVFVDEDMLGNATLEAPDRTTAFKFLSFHALASAALNRLAQYLVTFVS